VRTQIRPFVRAARPFVADLSPAAEDLAEASPDLTKAFYELNRFFNMASYNPGGAEPLTGNRAQDLRRDEGYLFWVAWIAQNTNSIFNTADAQGVLRRGQFTVSCDTLRDTLNEESMGAIAEPLGLLPALNDPNICGTSAP
jgi:phospholipid/cholesterol/gamma-HCH transport system substrate-binding protein